MEVHVVNFYEVNYSRDLVVDSLVHMQHFNENLVGKVVHQIKIVLVLLNEVPESVDLLVELKQIVLLDLHYSDPVPIVLPNIVDSITKEVKVA